MPESDAKHAESTTSRLSSLVASMHLTFPTGELKERTKWPENFRSLRRRSARCNQAFSFPISAFSTWSCNEERGAEQNIVKHRDHACTLELSSAATQRRGIAASTWSERTWFLRIASDVPHWMAGQKITESKTSVSIPNALICSGVALRKFEIITLFDGEPFRRSIVDHFSPWFRSVDPERMHFSVWKLRETVSPQVVLCPESHGPSFTQRSSSSAAPSKSLVSVHQRPTVFWTT